MFKFHNFLRREEGTMAVIFIIIFALLTTAVLATTFAVLDNRVSMERSINRINATNLAEAGIEKAVWEYQRGNTSYAGEIATSYIDGGQFDVVVTPIDSNNKYIKATGYIPNKANAKYKRAVRVKISDEPSITDVSFHYGVQVGSLGVNMSNNSRIAGNVYTSGSIIAGNNSVIEGDAFVSGAGGKIVGATVAYDAHAHTIENSSVGHDAYYYSEATIINSIVTGTKHPGSPDPEEQSLPIVQSTVDSWEAAAVAGGTIEGDYTLINFATGSLGPKKINGNLLIDNGATLTITGTLWVTGNVTFTNNAVVRLDPGYGPGSGVIVADSLTDKATFGKIIVSNNVALEGSGDPKSYIMMFSTNTGSTVGNSAINAGNNSMSVIYYAMTGFLEVSNNARLKALTGGGLNLANGAIVEYESGLANVAFTNGPGGTWMIREWQEVKA